MTYNRLTLPEKWRKEADQYAAQAEELRRSLAIASGADEQRNPQGMCMTGMATALRQCAKELQNEKNSIGQN